MVREVLFDEVNFEKKSERRASHEDNWPKTIQGEGNSKCQCPVASTQLVYSSSSKELSVSGGDRTRGSKYADDREPAKWAGL